MNSTPTYTLQRYEGIRTRHTCPGCGRKRCFTLYVNEDGEPLDETVGRCDHESSCGYHYTPKQYFHDHPERVIPIEREDSPLVIVRRLKVPTWQSPKPINTIPPKIVTATIRPDIPSHPTSFLSANLGKDTVNALVRQYCLGVTRERDIIYWQTDIQGRTRTGKIMKYNPLTGHRIKDESTPSKVTWVHSLMKRQGTLPQDWQLTQCLFGEHLIPQHPDKKIALVESEKTALICAALMPQYLWLATGGKSQLSEDRLSVLRGRDVIAFPDVDAYDPWKQKLTSIPSLRITVSDYLNKTATPAQREAHIDLADLLLESSGSSTSMTTPACHPERSEQSPAFKTIAPYISPEHHAAVASLIQELDLIPLKVAKYQANEQENVTKPAKSIEKS